MDFKVAAVVVTYNRLELLKNCIHSLRNQTLKLDEIFVINNSSTDGTLDWLKQQNDLTVITQGNTGSAGGQYTGIKTAYNKAYDWILCTDDDTFFWADYLTTLLSFALTKNSLFLGGTVTNENNEILINHRGLLKEKIIKDMIQIPISIDDYSSEIVPVQFISFVGMLINRSVIEKIGLPNHKFFYQHDDVEYCFRISKYFSGLLIPSAKVVHKEPAAQTFIKFKNLRERKNQAVNITRLSYDVRNLTYTVLNNYKNPYLKLLSVTYYLFVQTRRIILYNSKKSKSLKIILKSFCLGARGNLSKNNYDLS